MSQTDKGKVSPRLVTLLHQMLKTALSIPDRDLYHPLAIFPVSEKYPFTSIKFVLHGITAHVSGENAFP